jgi:heat shock protein HslJ
MHRRHFVTTLGAGALSGLLMSARGARGQQATPAAAGPSMPILRWELRQMASGRTVGVPDHPEHYWIQFKPDGTVAVRADCNRGGGRYAVAGSSLTLSSLDSTKVACSSDSLSDKFVADLGYVVSFKIAGDAQDELVLSLMADGGELQFAPALPGVVWQWVSVEVDGKETERAKEPEKYTIAFDDEGGVTVQADCNRGSGKANVRGDKIDLTVATTRMACGDDSQGSDFLGYLDRAKTYAIKDSALGLALRDGKGIARFKPFLA